MFIECAVYRSYVNYAVKRRNFVNKIKTIFKSMGTTVLAFNCKQIVEETFQTSVSSIGIVICQLHITFSFIVHHGLGSMRAKTFIKFC